MAKSMEYFEKILKAEQEKCLGGLKLGIELHGEEIFKRSGLEQSCRDSLKVKPAAAVLEAYAKTGSNIKQRNIALMTKLMLTEDMRTVTFLYPMVKVFVETSASVVAKQRMRLPLDKDPTTLSTEQKKEYDKIVGNLMRGKDFDFSKVLLSGLFIASIKEHKPTDNKSGFARALAVIIPELKLEIPQATAAAIVIGAVDTGSPRQGIFGVVPHNDKKGAEAKALMTKLATASQEPIAEPAPDASAAGIRGPGK